MEEETEVKIIAVGVMHGDKVFHYAPYVPAVGEEHEEDDRISEIKEEDGVTLVLMRNGVVRAINRKYIVYMDMVEDEEE